MRPLDRLNLRDRLRAGFVHLCVCVVIAVVLVGIVFGVWYPMPLDRAEGVLAIFLLLLGVDVTIGPLLTVLVFDRRKKSLPLDLGVIAILQVAALLYGMHSVYEGRPAFLVFNVDRFDLVAANDVDPKSQEKATTEAYRNPSISGPIWIGALLPKDPKVRAKLLDESISGGYDLPQLPEYYVPMSDVIEAIKARLQPLAALAQFNSAESLRENASLQEYQARPETYGYLPLRGRRRDLTVIVERQTGSIVKILDLNPWKG